MNTESSLYERAKAYAKEQHDRTGATYGNKPYYEGHILGVLEYGEKYLYLIPEHLQDEKLAGLAVHDVIEDTGITFNDVKNALGENVAEYAFAMTTPKGKTRKERHCWAYYDGIKQAGCEWDKLCDRLYNVQFSKENGSKQFDMYKKEQEEFKKNLQSDFTYAEMWHELDGLLYTEDELLDQGIKEYSLIQNAKEQGLFVIIDVHVKFDKHSLPLGRYPKVFFVCVNTNELLKKIFGESYLLTVIKAEDAIMHI